MAPISPEKIIEDKDTLLSPKEKKELREYMKKNPTEVQKQAVVSLENNYKIKDLLNTKKPAEMNREEIAVVQLYANLLGKKISVDGIYGPNTTLAVNQIRTVSPTQKKVVDTKPTINTITDEQKVAVKKSVDKNTTIEKNNVIKDSVDMSVAYLSHQQGSGGATQILNEVLFGEKVSPQIMRNMRGNIGSDFKEYTGDPRSALNAKNFFKYRYKKFNYNLETQGNTKTIHDKVFERVSKETGMAVPLLKAVVYTESGFDANLNMGKSTQFKGLMQLGKDVRKTYGVENPFDPYQNMIGGVKTMKGNMTPTLVSLSNNLKSMGITKVLGADAGASNV